jgi:L,D-peptidoglycan transpeptidase YkuD (ErfK/YbiS/YcfS/YnhG family)
MGAPKAGFLALLVVTGTACAGSRSVKQMIAVRSALDPEAPFKATVELQELDDQGHWRSLVGPFDAVVGKNGFAAPGDKREGDGKSPSGTFAVGTVFGYDAAPAFPLKMRYRQATDRDFWVDDVASAQYNQWVSSAPDASSWEKMRRADDLYSLGAVIEYNTKPIVPGHGSAIFLHVWRDPDKPTAGCVALAKLNLQALLSALNPSLSPVVVLNP